jgi:hypothetical protein
LTTNQDKITYPSILEQFRSFCYQNSITNLDIAIEYFTVFGGMGWKVDTNKSVEELIEEKVLNNYRYIHADITTITQSNQIHHKLLSALSIGERKEHTAFKKARVSREDGEQSIDFLIENGILILDQSVLKPIDEEEEVSDKLLFAQPFMRFWFASISPYYKGIKANDYEEVKKQWNNTKQEFSNHIIEQLVLAMIKDDFNSNKNDKIETIGSYWDNHTSIDIFIKTKSGKLIAGNCKYSKSKAKKSELGRLKDDIKKAELEVNSLILFSKNKFSSELKKEKSNDNNLKLYSFKSLNSLLKDISRKDFIPKELLPSPKMY